MSRAFYMDNILRGRDRVECIPYRYVDNRFPATCLDSRSLNALKLPLLCFAGHPYCEHMGVTGLYGDEYLALINSYGVPTTERFRSPLTNSFSEMSRAHTTQDTSNAEVERGNAITKEHGNVLIYLWLLILDKRH